MASVNLSLNPFGFSEGGAAYKVFGLAHDAAFGNGDFNIRPYDEFLQDAATIATANPSNLHNPSKITWGFGNKPAINSPWLFQGVVRSLEGAIGMAADGAQSSEITKQWTMALLGKHIIREGDKNTFENVRTALIAQSKLYRSYRTSKGNMAADNYEISALYLNSFINRSRIDVNLENIKDFSKENRKPFIEELNKILSEKIWFQLLRNSHFKLSDLGLVKEQELVDIMAVSAKAKPVAGDDHKEHEKVRDPLVTGPEDDFEQVQTPSAPSID